MTDGTAECSRSPCSRRCASCRPVTTYRSLLAGVNARVEREVGEQRPVLEPVDVGGPADSLVFDGTILRAEATFHVTRSATGFEVDAGSIHGLRSASGGEAFDLASWCPGPRRSPVSSGSAKPGRPRRRRADWLAAGEISRTRRSSPPCRCPPRSCTSTGTDQPCVRADPPGAVERRARRHAVAVRRGRGRGRRRRNDGAGDAKGAPDAVGDRLVLRVAAVADGYTVDRIEAGRPTPLRASSGPVFRILRAGRHTRRGRPAGTRRELGPCRRRAPRAHRSLGAAEGARRSSVAAA